MKHFTIIATDTIPRIEPFTAKAIVFCIIYDMKFDSYLNTNSNSFQVVYNLIFRIDLDSTDRTISSFLKWKINKTTETGTLRSLSVYTFFSNNIMPVSFGCPCASFTYVQIVHKRYFHYKAYPQFLYSY